MKNTKKYSRRNRRRSGSVIVMVALSAVMLFGFCAMAVDYGRSVVTRNTLQRACDAAALAGVAYLPTDPTNARVAARYFAFQNGVDVPSAAITINSTNTRITVPATRQVRYFFAPVMKLISGNVAARSVAAVQQKSNFLPPNVVPIGITPSTYAANKNGNVTYIDGIRQNKSDLDIAEFVLFDLRSQNSKSPAHMQDQLQWGSTFNEVTLIGGTETTLNAANVAQAKKFEDGINSRFAAALGATYNDNGTKYSSIPAGTPRQVNLILTPEQQAVNGNNNALVLGFVPVYIEAITVSGSSMQMRVRFLPLDAMRGGEWIDATNTSADSAALRIPRLVS